MASYPPATSATHVPLPSAACQAPSGATFVVPLMAAVGPGEGLSFSVDALSGAAAAQGLDGDDLGAIRLGYITLVQAE